MPLRRTYLRTLGLCTAGMVAGCNGSGTDSDAGTETTAEPVRTEMTRASTTESSRIVGEQAAKIAPAQGGPTALFGESVAMAADGETVLVGAPGSDTDDSSLAGAAYVFEKGADGWTQRTRLVADDGARRDRFGGAVALAADGRTAIVGSQGDTVGEKAASGSVDIFTETDGGWTRQTVVTPDDADSGDRFGCAVAMAADGETALVGAFANEEPNGANGGSAYLFTADGDGWSQRSKLTADDGDADDFFGWAVALADDGRTVLVGAPGDEADSGQNTGSVYAFGLRGGEWQQGPKLTADDGDGMDFFGRSVALSAEGTVALVGAENDEDPNGSGEAVGTGAGSAYVFGRRAGSWSQRAKLAPEDGDSGDQFGSSGSLAADGETAIVGATTDNDPNGRVEGEPTSGAGSAYVFTDGDGGWQRVAKLAAADGDSGDRFGRSVALDAEGTTAFVGAQSDEDPNGSQAGAAYVFD
jgi:hypothetical protein